MELIRIGEEKLKLTLSPEDMGRFGLDAEYLDWSDTGTRRAMWSILDEAKRRCGFDAARDKVLVRVFPSLAGGCEIFVTCVGGRSAGCGNDFSLKVLDGAPREEDSVYSFDGISELLDCCRALARSGFCGNSRAFSCDDGRALLVLSEQCATAQEFGEKQKDGRAEIYIGEHTSPICEKDAVKVLSAL